MRCHWTVLAIDNIAATNSADFPLEVWEPFTMLLKGGQWVGSLRHVNWWLPSVRCIIRYLSKSTVTTLYIQNTELQSTLMANNCINKQNTLLHRALFANNSIHKTQYYKAHSLPTIECKKHSNTQSSHCQELYTHNTVIHRALIDNNSIHKTQYYKAHSMPPIEYTKHTNTELSLITKEYTKHSITNSSHCLQLYTQNTLLHRALIAKNLKTQNTLLQTALTANNCIHKTHFIVRHGILLGPLDSVIGRNVLNYALHYHISLDSIMNTDIQPRDIIGRINAEWQSFSCITSAAGTLTL